MLGHDLKRQLSKYDSIPPVNHLACTPHTKQDARNMERWTWFQRQGIFESLAYAPPDTEAAIRYHMLCL